MRRVFNFKLRVKSISVILLRSDDQVCMADYAGWTDSRCCHQDKTLLYSKLTSCSVVWCCVWPRTHHEIHVSDYECRSATLLSPILNVGVFNIGMFSGIPVMLIVLYTSLRESTVIGNKIHTPDFVFHSATLLPPIQNICALKMSRSPIIKDSRDIQPHAQQITSHATILI